MSRLLAIVTAVVLIAPVAASSKITRLDPNVSPTFEAIELDIDANKTEYSGSVRIELEVKSTTSEFSFHAREMTLDHVGLEGDQGLVAVLTDVDEEGLVRARTEILPAGSYTLTIDFHKEFNTSAVGLYRMEKDGQGYLFSQFESVDARRAFPCWDEPIYKIPFEVTIHIPSDQVAVTNTPVESESEVGTRKTIVFRKTPPMPTYLLAVAAGPLESTPIPGLSVPGRIYTVRGMSQLTALAVKYTPPILEALEEYFGIPYPYEKLDFIAIPEYWPGAMENPGAVTWADRLLLMESKSASARQRQRLAYIQAHELAHMWFGDLVTMAWWDDLWLNESFATWLGGKIAAKLYPDYEIELDQLRDVQGLLAEDARPSTKPIRKPIDTSAAIWEDAGLAYGKGQTILGMVETWVGEDKFRKGVIDYIKTNEWGNARATDLFQALAASSGQDVTRVMSSFLDQSGYPMVSVTTQGRNIVIEQKRFLNYGVTAENQLWTVPIQLKYSDGNSIRHETLLLDKDRQVVTTQGKVDWVLPDAESVGYYRWQVPNDMLMRIAEDPLQTMTTRERATFLANCKALLDAKAMHGDVYLQMLTAYASTASPEIVGAVIDELGDVRNAFVTEDLIKPFAAYVRQTLEPAYAEVGLEAKKGEAEAMSLVRPRLVSWLGTEGQQEDVRSHCRSLAKKYMADPSSIDPTMGAVAIRVAAIDGDRSDYETYKQHFLDSQAPAVRSSYLAALGSFHDHELQREALRYSLEDDVRPTEIFAIPQRVNSAPGGTAIVFEWLTGNYDAIASRLPPEFVSFMPFFVSGCSRERLEALRAFFAEPKNNVEGTQNNVEKVSDGISDCASLRDREGKTVADYLHTLMASP